MEAAPFVAINLGTFDILLITYGYTTLLNYPGKHHVCDY